MSINQVQTAVTAKVWQAVAQSGIDTSGIGQDDMNKLVNLAVDAALEAVDMQLDQLNQQAVPAAGQDTGTESDGDEEVLWEGRSFLSLTLSYKITSERIKITEGFLAKEWTDVELIRVQAMDYKQSLTERALNVGDIFISTHDPNKPNITLENVKDPQGVHEILRQAVLKARKKYGLHYREEM